MRVAVLGAAGTIAPAIVRDLAESDEVDSLVLLDLDGETARDLAQRHGNGKATGAAADATDRQALMLAVEGCGVLLNSASYRINLAAMDVALAARCGYVDLGGLYHLSAKQYARSEEFEERGLLAVLGCGAGPGKTNVMAAHAASHLDEVHTVRTSSAGLDTDPQPGGLALPYALETLLDEMREPPMAVRAGEPVALEPLADGGEIDFPEPVGRRGSLFTLHSEVLTLPRTIGGTEHDFRLSLAPAVEEALRDVAAGAPAPPIVRPSAKTYSAQNVTVTGRAGGEATEVVVTALTVPDEAWGLGGGIISTASVAAATVRLFARGAFGGKAGCLAPEEVMTADMLFPELEARGCTFHTTINGEPIT